MLEIAVALQESKVNNFKINLMTTQCICKEDTINILDIFRAEIEHTNKTRPFNIIIENEKDSCCRCVVTSKDWNSNKRIPQWRM